MKVFTDLAGLTLELRRGELHCVRQQHRFQTGLRRLRHRVKLIQQSPRLPERDLPATKSAQGMRAVFDQGPALPNQTGRGARRDT